MHDRRIERVRVEATPYRTGQSGSRFLASSAGIEVDVRMRAAGRYPAHPRKRAAAE